MTDQANHPRSQLELPGAAAVRECLYFLSNFIVTEVVFVIWCLAVWLPTGSPRGEVVQAVMLMCALYLPLAYPLTYIALRLIGAVGPWALKVRSPRLGTWCTGVLLGLVLGIAGTSTRLFWVFNPVLRRYGP